MKTKTVRIFIIVGMVVIPIIAFITDNQYTLLYACLNEIFSVIALGQLRKGVKSTFLGMCLIATGNVIGGFMFINYNPKNDGIESKEKKEN